MSERAVAFALLASGMAIFGSGTPVSKLVTEAFPVFVGSAGRMTLAALVLVPLMVYEVRRRPGGEAWLPALSKADWLRVSAIAVAGMFLFSIFMLYGMREVSGAVGSIVMASTPAVTAAGSVLFLRDRLDRWTSIAIATAVGGVLIVNLGSSGGGSGSGDQIVLGSALVFGAVCGEAAYTLLGKRLSADLSPLAIAAIAASIATLLFAVPAIAQLDQVEWDTVAFTDFLALGWWGIGTMALGSWLWYQGVQRVPGTTASAFMGVMPISALVLSYVLLGESFEPIHAVGMVLMLGAIAAVGRSEGAVEDEDEG